MKTIKGDENLVLLFLNHARALPGQLRPEHFERWSNHLYLERGVVASSQRTYQTAVRVFFDYLLREPRFKADIRQTLGVELVQVSTPENSIIHRRERELERNNSRRSFTEAEAATFLERIDLEMALAYQQGSKGVRAHQRNKAMFGSTLEMGLRADEVLGLDTDSFEPNPEQPAMGDFGIVRVFGKGSKWRQVPILKVALSHALAWYMEHVRPNYLAKAAPGEKAMFLSEQGKRLSYSAFHREFRRIIELAGLPIELVPHCLRHTSMSSDDMSGLSLESNRQRHGHAHGSTMQVYIHHPDAYIRGAFNAAIARNLKADGATE
ncbi:tyrosine-type recombinase/integrase [Variovorax sp. PBL-H6]|uniref:tyrosine-type recombinase/integrase n=1 Tax=Variovorax sp. PBL-H6 TaxID=434009 RepID=UPI0013A5AA4D|nr:tyrosine-type recombinase/integrase [Variovorax sp. PBL-H6]